MSGETRCASSSNSYAIDDKHRGIRWLHMRTARSDSVVTSCLAFFQRRNSMRTRQQPMCHLCPAQAQPTHASQVQRCKSASYAHSSTSAAAQYAATGTCGTITEKRSGLEAVAWHSSTRRAVRMVDTCCRPAFVACSADGKQSAVQLHIAWCHSSTAYWSSGRQSTGVLARSNMTSLL